MPFRGVTFSGQNVTPKNDGGLYQAHYGDGILWGCSMAISGDDLVIQSGEFIMGGRVVQVDGATNVDLSGRSLTTGYIQVIMNADLSQGEGSQWYTSFVESATTTFPALTQDNINDTDTLYQLELAVVQISGGNLTSIYKSLPTSHLVSYASDNKLLMDADTGGCGLIHYLNDGTRNAGISFFNTGVVDTTVYGSGGNINIRPNGVSNPTGQFAVLPSGEVNMAGTDIVSPYSRLQLLNGNIVLGCNNGSIVFRPKGYNDNTNQFYMTNEGKLHSLATYNNTTTVASNLIINTAGQFFRSTSLRKFKENIKTVTEKDAEKGYKLNPVTFVSNIEADDKHEQYGFIAEEVNDILPNLNTYGEDGEVVGVAYERVCAILLKQNQMLKARVDELEKRVEKLEGK